MKRFSNAMTVASFFLLIMMFVVSSFIFSGSELTERLESTDPRTAFTGFVEDCFPMTGELKGVYAGIMEASGRMRFGDVCLTEDRMIRVRESYDQTRLNKNIACVNDLAQHTSVPVWIMLAPTAGGIYSDRLDPYLSLVNQKETIGSVYLSMDKSIGAIDVYYPLYSARDEYIYYRTSDCWTSFGAYCAYVESVGQLGLQAQTLSNYDQEYAASSYRGELYDQVRYMGIEADRINIFRSKYQSPVESVVLTSGGMERQAKSVYFKSALKTQDKTDVFLMGDSFERADIYTSNKDQPSLLIIKGSYANALVPFYTAHYSHITVIDPDRLYETGRKMTDILTLKDYDQILFMMDIDSFAEAEHLDQLR